MLIFEDVCLDVIFEELYTLGEAASRFIPSGKSALG